MPICLSKALRWLSNDNISAASTDNVVITYQSTQEDMFHISFWVYKSGGVAHRVMLGRKGTGRAELPSGPGVLEALG